MNFFLCNLKSMFSIYYFLKPKKDNLLFLILFSQGFLQLLIDEYIENY